MIQAILFDVDGVLLDSVDYHFRAWKALFDQINIPFTYEDYVAKVNGLPRNVGIKNIAVDATDLECARYAAIKQDFLLSMVREKPLAPLPGVVEFLEHLIRHGIHRAAASSSKNAPLFLQQAGLADLFETIVSGSDFSRPKPDPELFELAAKRLNVAAPDCLVVEDATSGVQAAHAAGMKAVGLTHSSDPDIAREADMSIHSLLHFQKIIKKYGLL